MPYFRFLAIRAKVRVKKIYIQNIYEFLKDLFKEYGTQLTVMDRGPLFILKRNVKKKLGFASIDFKQNLVWRIGLIDNFKI